MPEKTLPATGQAGLGRLSGRIILVFLLLGAFALRVIGRGRGLPYIHEWDEPTVLSYVIGMLQRGDLYPNAFVYPSVYYYLLLPVMYAHYFYLRALDLLGSPNAIALFHPHALGHAYWWYISEPSFYAWGRVLTAILGTATVFLVYRIGKATFGSAVALLAAAFLAVSPGAIYYAATVRVDVPMAFFVTVTMLVGLRLVRGGRRVDYLLAGLLAGLAFSTKYNAAVVLIPLGIAHLLNPQRGKLVNADVFLLGACFLAGYVVGTPYVLIRPDLVLAQMRDNTLAYGIVPREAFFTSGLPMYLRYLVRPGQGHEWYVIPHTGFGVLPAVLAVIGLAAGFGWRRREHLYLASFPVLFIPYMAAQRVIVLRNMAAALPLLALLAAIGAVWIWQKLVARMHLEQKPWKLVLLAALLVAIIMPSAKDSFALGWTMRSRPDTRRAAVQWLRQHVQPDATVAFDESLRWFLPELSRLPFRVLFAGDDAPRNWYTEHGVDYAVVGETNPLRDLPAAQTFSRPPYVYTGDWTRDTYPVIDPKVAVVELRSLEVRDTFPSQVSVDHMLREPVARQSDGKYRQVIRLPRHRFEPGEYVAHISGLWPWLWTSASSSLRLQVQIGEHVVVTASVRGDQLLDLTTPPFQISQADVLPVQIALEVQIGAQRSGWALRPASQGCALAPDSAGLNPSLITVEAWAFAEGMHPHPGAESEAPIVTKNNADGYYLRLSGDGNQIWVDLNVAGKWAVGRGGLVPLRKWTHIAATYDGREAKIYVDGKQASQDPNRSPIHEGVMQSAGFPLVIGCREPGEPYGVVFKGLITGVRVWDRVLSAEEIQQEAALRRLPENAPGLVGSWTFQSLVGGVIPDLSPAGNNITNGASLQRVSVPEMQPELLAWMDRRLSLLQSVTLRRVSP